MSAASPARARVLVIAPHGSYRTAPYIEAADKLGIDVLIASEGEHSIASCYAQGLHVRFDAPDAALEKIIAAARQQPFNAIVATDDTTTELAARVACALGLPHNAPDAARLTHRKDLARTRLAQHGASVPAHWHIDLTRALEPQAQAVSYPCVLKPVALSASRGVIRVDDPGEFVTACARIGRMLASERDVHERTTLLAESFIAGVEVAVEGLLSDGNLTLLAIFDKPDPLDGPYFEETYYITPSRQSPEMQGAIRHTVQQACTAYGLRTGPIHAECRINDGGVWIIEVAARTIGGLCARLLRSGTGYGLEELVLLHAMGRDLTLSTPNEAAGVLMIPVPRSGILRRIEGLAAAQRVEYIEEIAIQIREGYEIVPWPEGSSYLGFMFARAPTPQQVEAALRHAHAQLNIVVAPLWHVALAV